MDKRADLPGFFRKREMLDAAQPPQERLSKEGRKLLEEGLLDEALSFFLKAGDREGTEAVLEKSRLAGDAFSFEAALRALERTATKKEWEELGEKALAKGFLWFAYRAFEKADHQPSLDRVRQEMGARDIPPPT